MNILLFPRPCLFCSHVHIFDRLSWLSGRDRQVARAASVVHTFCMSHLEAWFVLSCHFWIPSACDNFEFVMSCRVSKACIYGILWHPDLIWLCKEIRPSLSMV
jgi:hypothetical protein